MYIIKINVHHLRAGNFLVLYFWELSAGQKETIKYKRMYATFYNYIVL